MSDALYTAAYEYKKLKNVIYEIILGRKEKTITIMLTFPDEAFFHLAGLQHLTDIQFSSFNKQRIFKDIISKKITDATLEKSVFYADPEINVKERIENLVNLQKIIESNSFIYMIQDNRYKSHTGILADYLCEYIDISGTTYFFIVKVNFPKIANECKGCSFFKKHKLDYTRDTSKTTVLLIQKIENETTTEIYRKETYIPNKKED